MRLLLNKDMTKPITNEELREELSVIATKDELKFEFNELKKEMREREKRLHEKYLKILEKLAEIVSLLKND
jgi:hypothetical protein